MNDVIAYISSDSKRTLELKVLASGQACDIYWNVSA